MFMQFYIEISNISYKNYKKVRFRAPRLYTLLPTNRLATGKLPRCRGRTALLHRKFVTVTRSRWTRRRQSLIQSSVIGQKMFLFAICRRAKQATPRRRPTATGRSGAGKRREPTRQATLLLALFASDGRRRRREGKEGRKEGRRTNGPLVLLG